MADRSHLSIGAVLSLLREEFPDVTISKIRFLESQGLVDPERTPSGYRKFYEHDVDRLRWILRQQRENFLPLKIIRGRLTEHDDDSDEPSTDGDGVAAVEQSLFAADEVATTDTAPRHRARPAGTLLGSGTDPGSRHEPRSRAETATAGSPRSGAGGTETHPAGAQRRREAALTTPSGPGVLGSPDQAAPSAPALSALPGGATAATPASAPTTAATPSSGSAPRLAPAPTAGLSAGPTPGPAAKAAPAEATTRGPAAARPDGSQLPLGDEAETYSAEELAHAAGGNLAIVKEIQQFGLISARIVVGGMPYFDATALDVVRAAVGFARHGVEARHLRAWRNAADREAGLFEQLIVPLLRQRNPEARKQAAAMLNELATLGGDLHKALIDQALRQIR